MNNFVGTPLDQQASVPSSWLGGGNYVVFLKSTDFTTMSTSDCFVLVDESPLSLNDGWFEVDPSSPNSDGIDKPAVNHGKSSCFSYADGHVALKKWNDCFVISYGNSPTSFTDNQWLCQHASVHK